MSLVRKLYFSQIRRFIYKDARLMVNKECPPPTSGSDYHKVKVSSAFKRLKNNQKKFQADDGLPVWLKGGFKDKILYQLTLVLLFISLGWGYKTLLEMAFKDVKW